MNAPGERFVTRPPPSLHDNVIQYTQLIACVSMHYALEACDKSGITPDICENVEERIRCRNNENLSKNAAASRRVFARERIWLNWPSIWPVIQSIQSSFSFRVAMKLTWQQQSSKPFLVTVTQMHFQRDVISRGGESFSLRERIRHARKSPRSRVRGRG